MTLTLTLMSRLTVSRTDLQASQGVCASLTIVLVAEGMATSILCAECCAECSHEPWQRHVCRAEPLPRDAQAPPAAAGLVQLLTYEGSLLPPPTAGLSQGLRVDDMRVALLAHPAVVPRLTALVSHSGE